jgi:hypothetical protein
LHTNIHIHKEREKECVCVFVHDTHKHTHIFTHTCTICPFLRCAARGSLAVVLRAKKGARRARSAADSRDTHSSNLASN